MHTGDQHDVLRLCTRSAGWDVPRREGGKDRPLPVVLAELTQSLLSATRRHLEARGSDDSHLAAASRADAGTQPTSAKRSLRSAPTTEDAKRLRPLRDELATQPPRKKLKELAADMDVPEMRGDAAGILYKRVRGTIIKVAADEPDALDLASPGQAPESSGAHASTAKRTGGAGAHRTLLNPAASRSRTKGRKKTDKERWSTLCWRAFARA